jgi:hypothetical protein
MHFIASVVPVFPIPVPVPVRGSIVRLSSVIPCRRFCATSSNRKLSNGNTSAGLWPACALIRVIEDGRCD